MWQIYTFSFPRCRKELWLNGVSLPCGYSALQSWWKICGFVTVTFFIHFLNESPRKENIWPYSSLIKHIPQNHPCSPVDHVWCTLYCLQSILGSQWNASSSHPCYFLCKHTHSNTARVAAVLFFSINTPKEHVCFSPIQRVWLGYWPISMWYDLHGTASQHH